MLPTSQCLVLGGSSDSTVKSAPFCCFKKGVLFTSLLIKESLGILFNLHLQKPEHLGRYIVSMHAVSSLFTMLNNQLS